MTSSKRYIRKFNTNQYEDRVVVSHECGPSLYESRSGGYKQLGVRSAIILGRIFLCSVFRKIFVMYLR